MSSDTYWKLTRPSRASGKKWQVLVPTKSGRGKVVPFGDASMEDYTIHKDKKRRENYRSRHRKDKIYDPYKAGFWSWWSLWGESSDLKKAHAHAVQLAKKILKKKGVDVSVRTRENPDLPGMPSDAPMPTMADVSQVVSALEVPKNLRAEFMAGFGVEWEHAHTVNYDMLTVGKIVMDHLAEDPRYYRKLKRARLNPLAEGAQPSDRVRSCFDTLLTFVHESYPDLVCSLVVSEDAGLRGGERCARAYAYCTDLPDGSFVIHVAPKMDDADDSRIDGLMRHELSHAVLLHTGDLEHTERDADEIAEELFGAPLYYDQDDVQTTDPSAPGARRPRPAYLDDEHGRTLDSAAPEASEYEDVRDNPAEDGYMRLETVGDVCEALDNASATGDHKTPRIIASKLSQAALEMANPQARIYRSLAKAARHCANGIEARLAGEIDRAMASERLCDRALAEASDPTAARKNPRKKAGYGDDYKYFIVDLDGNPESGWEYREDAQDDLRDGGSGKPGLKIVARSKVNKGKLAAFFARNRDNPEWAKSLGRGLYKGARYAGESALDLYRGMREAHGEYDDVIRQLRDEAGEHGDMEQVELCDRALQGDKVAYAKCVRAIESAKAMADEDAIPGDMTRENPEWARKLGRAAAAPRRAKKKLAESAAAKKKKAAEKAAAAKAAWASKKARARDYLDEVKRDLAEGFRSNPRGLKKPRKHPAFRTGRKPVGPRGSIRAFVFKEGDGFRAAVGIKMNGQEGEEILAESPKVLYSTMEEAVEVAEATADDFILNGIPFIGGKLKPEFVH